MGKKSLKNRFISALRSIVRKNREKSNALYTMFRFMPDKTYLSLMYKLRLGKKLNLDNPESFNEKIQWLKLYDHRQEYIRMVDKYEAKQYAASVIGDEHIIPTLGVWDKFDDIDFEKLPNQFVLKCTHDSGGLVICKDKNSLDKNAAKRKIEQSLKCNFFYVSREWPYKFVKPRIVAEMYMEDKAHESLKDYKFYCFNGEPKFLYLSEGLENHETARISYVNLDWTFADYRRSDYLSYEKLPPEPVNLSQMIDFSRRFAKGIPFVRVDFYEINGKVYFGELTFYPGGGFTPFATAEQDKNMGKLLELPKEKI